MQYRSYVLLFMLYVATVLGVGCSTAMFDNHTSDTILLHDDGSTFDKALLDLSNNYASGIIQKDIELLKPLIYWENTQIVVENDLYFTLC